MQLSGLGHELSIFVLTVVTLDPDSEGGRENVE